MIHRRPALLGERRVAPGRVSSRPDAWPRARRLASCTASGLTRRTGSCGMCRAAPGSAP